MRVLFDYRPALRQRTGAGEYAHELARALLAAFPPGASEADLELLLFSSSWKDRLVLPGVREVAHRLLDAAGLIRHAGPGTLELAWVAAGRLDAWIQPAVDPWDWVPGALLVTQAGGVAKIVEAGTRWHIAGPEALVEELEGLLR